MAYLNGLARSDYGAFWKRFSKALREDPNIPWDQIEPARVQPEFVGIALSLIKGNSGARDAVRTYFADLELPETAYETQSQVEEKILRAALDAAIKAPKDDRDAAHASERRLEETIRSESHDRRDQISDLGDKVDQLKEAFAEPGTRDLLERKVEDAFQRSEEKQRENSQEQIEKLEELNSELVERVGELLDTGAVTPEKSGPTPPEAPRPASTTNDDETVEGLLHELEAKDGESSAQVLREIYASKDSAGVIDFLRDESRERSAAQLDTAANIVALQGFFLDAERGHLAAAAVAELPNDQARQFVRAAGMAQVQGADRRYRAHLEKARRIAPNHPAVAIATARSCSDGDEMIRTIEGVEPESEKQRAILHVTRAQGWLLQKRSDLARSELTNAERTGVNTLPVREMRAMVAWIEGKETVRDGGEAPQPLFLQAAEEFEGIAKILGRQQRADESAHITARAAESFGLAGDIERAVQLLEGIEHPDALSAETRESLAEAAMAAQRPKLVVRFIGQATDGSNAGILWADATLLEDDSDPQDKAKAVEILLPHLTSADEDLRGMAALALLGGAATHSDVAWNDSAAAIVRERMPVAEASMKAQVLNRDGQEAEAENVLLPFASDPKALRQLRDLAADRGDWTKARDRSAKLLDISKRPIDRLALADTTNKSGASAKARELFLAAARDRDADERIRGMGYSGAVEIASEARDYEEIRRLSQEWHSELPDDPNGTWNLLFGLARVAQHQKAYELFKEVNPDPNTQQRASLLAEILGRAAPKLEAMQSIASLSDRYDRSVEALEGLFLKVSLEAEQEQGGLPPELEERIRDAWATFPTRFPDQEFMEVFEAPPDWEGFEKLLKEMGGGNSARAQKKATDEIIAGELPVNGLAAAAPHGSIGRCWLGLGFLPLGFCMEEIDRIEVSAALEAIGGAAVWDSSSLFVVGGLGNKRAESLMAVLPASQIASETLEDADAGVESLPAEGGSETVQDPDTGALLGLREHTKESLERLKAASEGMLGLAQKLNVAPGVGENTEPEMREAYEKAQRREWRAVIASLALAKRVGLPLFSDDRWIRRVARDLGIKTFGTVALVSALEAKGVLKPIDRQKIRAKLAASFAWGIAPEAEDLIAAAEESGWQVDSLPLGALNDRAAWRARPTRYIQAVIKLLDAVYAARPDQLGFWMRQGLAAFNQAFPEIEKARASQLLLLLAWDIQDEPSISPACFRAIVREIRALPPSRRIDAPVFAAIADLMDYFADQPNQIRFLAFMRVISRLSGEDAFKAFIQFVAPGPPIDLSGD